MFKHLDGSAAVASVHFLSCDNGSTFAEYSQSVIMYVKKELLNCHRMDILDVYKPDSLKEKRKGIREKVSAHVKLPRNFLHDETNSICQALGEDKSRAIPFFHAFSGCDTTLHKAKKSVWEAWKSFQPATTALHRFFRSHFSH